MIQLYYFSTMINNSYFGVQHLIQVQSTEILNGLPISIDLSGTNYCRIIE